MIIGVPAEILHDEWRVAVTPETVRELVSLGYNVTVEKGAGTGVFVSDEAYAQAGARIEADPSVVFGAADMVLKVKQPCFNEQLGRHEAELLRPGSVLVAFLHPASPGGRQMVPILRDRRITAFTMDGIPRISTAQAMDALTSMSTITGYKSVIHAAAKLPIFVPLVGTAIGVIQPARFLVVGVGVVGLQAIATAKRLGGVCTCVDIRHEARETCRSMGAKVAGFEVPDDLATGEGGYARSLPDTWLEKEREFLTPLVHQSDVVILSALVPNEEAPVLVTAEMVAGMKPGSVIIDVAIDQGGNCAVTQAGEEIHVDQVLISGIQNIPGSMAVHATWFYSKNMLEYVKNLCKAGPGQIDWEDEIVRASLVTRDGQILHAGTLKAIHIHENDGPGQGGS
jgi:H+-translocating NAD(P) transhydrogenase subunit alpha